MLPIFSKWLRIFFLAIKSLQRFNLRTFSLTYYTVFAVVPLVALFSGIAHILGLHVPIRRVLLERFAEQQEVVLKIFALAQQMLEGLHRGLIAATSGLVLFVSVWFLFNHLELGLNQLWDVKKHRSWKRNLVEDFTLMITAPFLFFLASSIGIVLEGRWGIRLVILPWVSCSLIFAFIYWVIPNCKVSFVSALIGGIVGASLYLVAKWGYFFFQLQAARYASGYGGAVALPLLLAWVQTSWYLFLFGASLGHAHQTLSKSE